MRLLSGFSLPGALATQNFIKLSAAVHRVNRAQKHTKGHVTYTYNLDI